MIPVSLFKTCYSHANVVVCVLCVAGIDCCFVYTMSLLMHLFCTGHPNLFLQLQFSTLISCGWLFLIICVVWPVIIDLTLLMQLQLTLTVFLLKILCNLLPIGKCVCTSLRKLRAMFVLTFLLNGGLNQMMLRYLFPRGCCITCGMYSSLWLKLLCPSAF